MSPLTQRYQLKEQLARTWSGVVWRALDTERDRDVALKRFEFDQPVPLERRTRFQRQLELLAQAMPHPHVARVLDVGEDGDCAFLALELLAEARPLTVPHHGLPVAEVLRVGVAIADALQHVHAEGVLHLALMPDSLLVSPRSAETVKVSGFGVACLEDLSHLMEATGSAGSRGHSPARRFWYLAPEQAGLLRRPVGPATDLYALGVILYELLTGAPPFPDDDPGAVLHGHLARKPAPVTRDDVSPELAGLVAELLEKEPEARPRAARTVLGRLLKLRDGEVESAASDRWPAVAPEMAVRQRVPLVARDAHQAALASLVGRARGGQGGVVLLAGEAGLGKSRLIEATQSLAQEVGGRLLVGKCTERAHPRPLAPFAEAVAEYRAQLRGLPRARRLPREACLNDRCPHVLASRFADVAGVRSPYLPGGHDQRNEHFARCVSFLQELSSLEPVLLLAVDDLQWADEGTLELFARLGASASGTNLVLLGAYRPGELGLAGRDALERVARKADPDPLAIELEPLGPKEAHLLAAAYLGEGASQVVGPIYDRVGGNPLHLSEVIKALVGLGGLTRDATGWQLDASRLDDAALRAGVGGAIRARAELLGPEAYRALGCAAAIGRGFTLDLLVDVSDLRPSRALQALEQGQDAGLLQEDGGRLRWTFTHDKVREALYSGLDRDALAQVHEAIGDGILAEAEGEPSVVAAELAEHYDRAGRHVRALEYHLLAGERALASYVMQDAGEHFGRALVHLDPDREPKRFATTVASYASARRYAGDYPQLMALLKQALQIARATGEETLVGEILGRLAMVAEVSGSPDAEEWIEQFVAVSKDSPDPRAAVIATAMLAYHYFDRGNPRKSIEHFERSLARGGIECLDLAEAVNAQAVLGYAKARCGEFEEGVRLIEGTIEKAEQVGRSVVGWTSTIMGALHLEWGEWEAGLPYLDRARRILEDTGDVFYLYIARATEGLAYVFSGNHEEGLRRLADAVAFGEERGVRSYRHAFTCFGGEAELRAGRRDDAIRSLRESLGAANERGDPWLAARAQRVLAEAMAEEPERHEEAERFALGSLRASEEAGLRPEQGRALRILGTLHAARGEQAEAERAWSRARRIFADCRMHQDIELMPARFRGFAGAETSGEAPFPAPDLLHKRGFKTIVQVSRMVGATLDLDDLLHRALGAVVEVFGAERGFVLLDEGQGLAVRAARGEETASDLESALALAARVAREGPSHPGAVGDRSTLCVPIGSSPARAILYLENRLVADLFTPDDVLVLEAIAAQLAAGIQNAYAYQEIARLKETLERENVYLKEELATHAFPEIVGESEALRRALQRLEQVAPLPTTVLLRGETGTGKELFARAVHQHSGRRDGPLVRVNCSALSPALVTSELFGHERGAFTGATVRKLGRFELARGGTLFLDEIGDVPLETQLALLRVLCEGEFERVGGTQSIKADVRVVAATNRDLDEAVAEGSFRSDLLYRLNGFTIEIPALRERRGDTPLLATHFALKHARRLGKSIREVSPAALEALEGYAWPGNVRELEHVVERAVILSSGPVLKLEDDLPRRPRGGRETGGPVLTLVEHERRYVISVLERTGWTIKGDHGAAKILGLPPSTLTSRMKKLGIARPR